MTSKSASAGGRGVGVGFGVGTGGGGGKSFNDCANAAGAQKKRASTPGRSAGPKRFPQLLLPLIKPISHAAGRAGLSMSPSQLSFEGMIHGI